MNSESSNRDTILAALQFARSNLGPVSCGFLQDQLIQKEVLERCSSCIDPGDAFLGVIHGHASEVKGLEDEFFELIHKKMMKLGSGKMGRETKNLHDTMDLTQSVLTDLWPEFEGIQFRTLAEFLSLLSQRINWKIMDKAKRYRASKRREEMRVSLSEEDEIALEDEFQPWRQAASNEALNKLTSLLLKLPENEAQVLSLILRGEKLAQIASILKISRTKVSNLRRSGIRRLRESSID